jgi:uncharacterized integral membrane protein
MAGTPEPKPSSLGDRLRLGAGAGGLILLVIFFLQNLQDATINILWFEWETSMIWALLVAAVLGALVALALSWFRGRALRRRAERAAG